MKYTIKGKVSADHFTIEISQQFDINDLEKCYIEIINHKDWKVADDILWNACSCRFNGLDMESLKDIAKMTSKYADKRGNGKAACVVSKDLDFGIARMFELINEGQFGFKFRVFKTVESAIDWIKLPIDSTD